MAHLNETRRSGAYLPPQPPQDPQIPTLTLQLSPSSTPRSHDSGTHVIYVPSPVARVSHLQEDGLPEYLNLAYRSSLPPASFIYSPPPMCGPKCQTCGRVFCSFIIGVLFFLPSSIFLDFFFFNSDDQIKFEIHSFAMTEFKQNLTGGVQAKWELMMLVKNPNTKLSIEFPYLDITLKYGKSEVDMYRVENLIVEPTSETLCNVRMSVPSLSTRLRYTTTEWMANAGKAPRPFDLEIRFKFKYKSGNIFELEEEGEIKATCNALPVSFTTHPGGRRWTGRHPCETEDYNEYKKLLADLQNS